MYAQCLHGILLRTWVILLGCAPTAMAQGQSPGGPATLEITGHGETLWDVRMDTIRQALQQPVKQLVIADRAIDGDQILKDQVLSTLNGVLEQFVLVSGSPSAGGYTLTAQGAPAFWKRARPGVAAPAAAVSSLAQNVPDLSGTWVLDLSKSDFGTMPAPTSHIDVIDHQEPAFIITRTTATPNGDVATTLICAVDGKLHVNQAGYYQINSVLSWEGSTLVMVNTIETPDGLPVFNTERFELSRDGRMLTQRRTISFQGLEVAQTLVLTKHPQLLDGG